MNLMQLYRVAKLYYLDGLNQEEIGRRENLSRTQISRLLEQSRQQGIVRIEVLLPDQLTQGRLSELLAQELGLQSVVIAPVEQSELTGSAIADAIAAAAAGFLPAELKNCGIVGVGWGRTMYQTAVRMPYSTYDSGTLFVPLVGASGTSKPYLQVNTILDRLAQKQRGRSCFSSMQAFREREIPLTQLEVQRIHTMQRYWSELDVAVFGLGGRLQSSSFMSEEVDEDYIQRIGQSAVLGDILAQFFFADGTVLDLRDKYRQIAFSLERLQQVPKTICLAGGEEKVDAIYAAAKAGFLKILVTDSVTAQRLYEKIRRQMTP